METIDCTPTWSGLLLMMLELYEGKSVRPKSRKEVRENMLKEFKSMAHNADMWAAHVKDRLEYLRGELRAETISYGELLELQSLIPYIDKGDVELLEAAGVPESD